MNTDFDKIVQLVKSNSVSARKEVRSKPREGELFGNGAVVFGDDNVFEDINTATTQYDIMLKEMQRTRTIELSIVYLPFDFDTAPEYPDRDTYLQVGIS